MTLAEVQLEPSKFNDHWPFSYFYLHHFHFDLLNNYFFLDIKQQQQQDYQYKKKEEIFSLFSPPISFDFSRKCTNFRLEAPQFFVSFTSDAHDRCYTVISCLFIELKNVFFYHFHILRRPKFTFLI